MNTRDKILAKSHELFNKKGISKVSVRNICDELKISLGNFTYYFPDKQQIVIELYYKMIHEIESIPDKIEFNKNSIRYILEYHKLVFYIQNKYKFFYLNTFDFIKNISEIKKAFLRHVKNAQEKKKKLFQEYIENGVLHKNTDMHFLERLIYVSLIVNNFWIIDAEIQYKGKEKQKLLHYLRLCCSLIEPHLTKNALKEFHKYFNDLEKQ